jgi:hypothetical protein
LTKEWFPKRKLVSGFELGRVMKAQRRNRFSAADKPLHQTTPSPEGDVEAKIRINKGYVSFAFLRSK